MNPLNYISALGWQAKALLIISLVICSFVGGWQVHGWRTDADLSRSIAKQLKTSHTLTTQAEKIIKTKQAKEQEIKIVYRDIYHKITEQNDNRICFTSDSLKLWNDSIAGADNNRTEPAGEAAKNAAVVATVEEVLTNAAENFEACNGNAVKHNALIDKVETLKNKMCICSK